MMFASAILLGCRDRIAEVVDAIRGDLDAHTRYETALEVFFPSRPVATNAPSGLGGFSLLLMGAKDQSLVNEVVGMRVEGLMSPTNAFEISIESSSSIRDDSIELRFATANEPPEGRAREVLLQAFQELRGDGPDIQKCLDQGPFEPDPLIVKGRENCSALLMNPSGALMDLYASQLLRRVDIRKRKQRDETGSGVTRLLQRIDIIPDGCVRSLEQVGVDKFPRNFVVLNSADDFVIEHFLAYQALYRQRLDLEEGDRFAVMRRVFFKTAGVDLRSSRFLVEAQLDADAVSDGVGVSIDDRLTREATTAFCHHILSCVLRDISRYDHIRQPLDDVLAGLAGARDGCQKVKEKVRALWPELDKLAKQLCHTKRIRGRLLSYRDEMVSKMDEILSLAQDVSETCGDGHSGDVEETRQVLEQQRDNLAKRTLIGTYLLCRSRRHGWKLGKNDCGEIVDKITARVEAFLGKVREDARIREVQDIDNEVKKCERSMLAIGEIVDREGCLLTLAQRLGEEIGSLAVPRGPG